MEFSFQWYHETVRSSLINHEQSVRSPASQLPCLPPLLMSSPTVITDEVNIIWICKGLHKNCAGHVSVHWSSSGLWMHNFWHWECCAAQQGLFRRIATSLSKPSPSYNPSWHSYIWHISKCFLNVCLFPLPPDLMIAGNCCQLSAAEDLTVHQAAAGARKYCLFYCSHLQWHKQITSDKRPQHSATP